MPTIPLVKKEVPEALAMFGEQLRAKAEQLVSHRMPIEQRWVEDLIQYHGRDNPEVERHLKRKAKRSRVVINITRAKCNAAEARLYEMLFPTDDRNWSLRPTPEPALYDRQGADPSLDEKVALDRAKRMQTKIEDQLQEANYPVIAREVIHDAVVFGTGILKAPVLVNRFRRKWRKIVDGTSVVRVLEMTPDIRPAVERVSIWDFFPDLTAPSLEDAEFIMERRFLTRAQIRKFLQLPGYIPEQVMKVLQSKDRFNTRPPVTEQLRWMSGTEAVLRTDNRDELWEYHGPVPTDVLKEAGVDFPGMDEDDLPQEMECIVQFIGPYIIKADLNPLETNDRPYMTFVYEPDDLSPFGYGIPFLMRHSQRIVNATWRMMMENAAHSSRPQLVMNRTLVEPADGDWDFSSGKIWYTTDPSVPVTNAFAAIPIENFQQQYMAIYQLIRQIVDDEINLPQIAQGALQGAPPETASALAMLLQGANAVLKRVVRKFDDGITIPLIRRFYDYNMQYSDDEEIKGDFDVVARGSTTLLAKETQMQTVASVMQAAMSPALAPMTNIRELYKRFLTLMHFDPNEILLSDQEAQQQAQQMAQAQGMSKEEVLAQIKQAQLQFEMQRHQDLMKDRELNRQMKLQMAEIQRQIEMMRLAADNNIALEKIKADLAKVAAQETNKANLQANEAMIKQQFGSGL